MIWFLAWLLTVELVALAALPLAVRLLRPLPDRGYLFAKPLGMLLVSYACWLLGVFGVLRFQRETIAVVLLLLGAGCWALWGRQALRRLSTVRRAIWCSELLFVAFLAGAALVRAHIVEINSTEKPMDFALLNGIYRSEIFPPEDPWMSGHSISYYYFGYLLMATVAKLSGVPAAVGYNLSVALVFALLLAGSFSLVFNLLSHLASGWRLSWRLLGALTAPLMVGLMGNLEVGLEWLASRGMGDPAFWAWVNVKNVAPGPGSAGWPPSANWWWWHATRVIPIPGKPDPAIDEFPYFSFMLGDLHAHYSALPWALLIVAVALAAFLGRWSERRETTADLPTLVVPALCLGFLLVGNSWDFPIYTALFWGASLLSLLPGVYPRAVITGGAVEPEASASTEASSVPAAGGREWRAELAQRLRRLGLISLLSVLLYLPFMLGFGSQVRGIAPVTDRSPVVSLVILFGTFMLVLAFFLTWQAWPTEPRAKGPDDRRLSWALLGGGWLLIVGSWLLGSIALLVGFLVLAGASVRGLAVSGRGFAGPWPAGGNGRRQAAPLEGGTPLEHASAARGFLLLLVAGGLLLILAPEVVFIIDMFGNRMNTVFKFHYQAWLLLGLASSVAMVLMAARMRPRWLAWPGVVGGVLLVAVGLLYPLAATPAKAKDWGLAPTLDGSLRLQTGKPDEYQAIEWLSRSAAGRPVVLEASGGGYNTDYGRVSIYSGLPTVLGWAGHEQQWRGAGAFSEIDRRGKDVEAIYKTADRAALRALLDKYQVTYVFVGSLETEKYGAEVANRFEGLLEPVHRQGRVTVYRVPRK